MVAAVVGVVVGVSGANDVFTPGAGTATFTWDPASPTPQPFTGSIEGHAVSGVSHTSPIQGEPLAAAATASFPMYRWEGSFEGKRFDVTIDLHYPGGTQAAADPSSLPFRASGSYGSMPIDISTSVPAGSSLGDPDTPLDFAGTVGTGKVTGSIRAPTTSGGTTTVTATFRVAG